MFCRYCSLSVLGLFASFAVQADSVATTNADTLVISTPAVIAGQTNVYTHTTFPAQIDADLTLDNATYLRFMGANTTGTSTSPTDTKPVINIGTTAADVTLTVKGKSLFAATYRNSKSPDAWVNTGIDPAGNGSAAPSRIRVHLGVPNGAPGSTGCVKLDLKTSPSFGGNVFGPFWAEYLYINTSVKPNDSGYIDFMDVASSVSADISEIDNLNAAPARILFSGGVLFRNNATAHSAPLAVSAGHELILEGKPGYTVEYCKQYADCKFTARRGGIVRFRGGEVRLRNRGQHIVASDFNFLPWSLSTADNIVWEHTGALHLMESCLLVLESDDLLPHGATNGQVSIGNTTSNRGKEGYVNHCALDIAATVQHVNGLVSDSQEDDMIGIVTNRPYVAGTSTARGTLVFGEHDLSTAFNARCTAGVDVKKIGAGRLTVRHAAGESLTVCAGSVSFADVCAFDTLAVSNGVSLRGEVNVNAGAVFESNVDVVSLTLKLGEGAQISAAGALTMDSLSVGGQEIAAGTYETADWLAAGSAAVTVVRDSSQVLQRAVWTGAGADNLASTADNWDDASKVDFTTPVTEVEFATGGDTAVFTGALSYLAGLVFNAAGDFTLSGSAAANELALYGALTLDAEEAHAYTVDMPLRLYGADKQIVMPAAGGTLALRDLSGNCAIDIQGTKLSDLAYDYSTNGVVILENPRTEGDINHTKGGGTVILRGEVGVLNDGGTYTLDYGRYRNNKDINNGWCEMGMTRVESVVFHKKFQINGAGQVTGATGTSRFLTFAGVTNIFKELVTEVPSSTVVCQGGTVNVFEKGFYNKTGTADFTTAGATAANLAVNVFEGPVKADNTVRPLEFSGGYQKAIFRSPGNYSKTFLQMQNNVWLDLEAENAFDNTDFYFQSGAVMDLKGHNQRTRNLLSYGKSDSEVNRGTITSETPATLEVTGGARNRESCAWNVNGAFPFSGVSTNSTQQFTGPVSLLMSGSGYLLMNRNGAVESTGDVTVSSGTLEFAQRTSWPAVGAVTAEGAGKLVLGKADTFGRNVKLRLAGSGTLALPAAATMRVGELWLDDGTKPAPSGVYGVIGDTGAKYTTSHILSGRVRVINLGTRLIIR